LTSLSIIPILVNAIGNGWEDKVAIQKKDHFHGPQSPFLSHFIPP